MWSACIKSRSVSATTLLCCPTLGEWHWRQRPLFTPLSSNSLQLLMLVNKGFFSCCEPPLCHDVTRCQGCRSGSTSECGQRRVADWGVGGGGGGGLCGGGLMGRVGTDLGLYPPGFSFYCLCLLRSEEHTSELQSR